MSTIKVSNIQSLSSATLPVIKDSAGTEYGRFCRAFVNFDGTGTTSTNQTIRASFNVSSVYKNGTGDYTVNFSNSFVDTNYASCFGLGNPPTNNYAYSFGASNFIPTTTSHRFQTVASSTNPIDLSQVHMSYFR